MLYLTLLHLWFTLLPKVAADGMQYAVKVLISYLNFNCLLVSHNTPCISYNIVNFILMSTIRLHSVVQYSGIILTP
jgi:hypothetical protein